jgi:hypothetical protein
MSQENHGRLAIMSFKGGCDLGQLNLSVSPFCLFVRRQCCPKLEAAKSNNFFKLFHATLIVEIQQKSGKNKQNAINHRKSRKKPSSKQTQKPNLIYIEAFWTSKVYKHAPNASFLFFLSEKSCPPLLFCREKGHPLLPLFTCMSVDAFSTAVL